MSFRRLCSDKGQKTSAQHHLILFASKMIVYIFAYFAHENALTAIAELSETGGELKLPKFLRVFSVIEMIISGAAALITLLLFMAIFAFN